CCRYWDSHAPAKIRLFRPSRLFGGDLMQTFRQNRATLLLAAALTLGNATISAQQPSVIDSAVLKKAGTPADQFPGSWLTYGKSQSEQRFSPLIQIDTSNVKRLGLAWWYVVGPGGYGQEGTP